MCGREIELAYEYVQVSAVLEIKVTVQNTAGVSNTRTAILYYAARRHNCKLCIQYKKLHNNIFLSLGGAVREAALHNRRGPLQ